MATEEIRQIAHLIRRAGFGATRDELEAYAKKGYQETVESLLHPEKTRLEPHSCRLQCSENHNAMDLSQPV